MPRNSNPKEQCSSCKKLIMKSNMSRHQKLHAKHNAQSFPDEAKLQKHIASVHAPSLIIKKKFSCSSCPLCFSTDYQLLNHKKVTNIQFLEPTRKLTFLSMETLPLFIVNFKPFNTFCETRFSNCPGRKFTTSK